ncbi:MAG: amidohydrolase family protein [Gammaproteobacteria bacterium]|jgi:L-fuconolactonase
MHIVDSHCHVGLNWYQPVESLLDEMQRNDVCQAVLVQMLGQFDNDYLFDCLERFPGRFACVVGIDVGAGQAACDQLADLAGRGVAGLRLRPQARSPGEDPLAIWRAAEKLGLVVSCVGNADTFAAAEFRELLCTVPELTVVLEHLGGTSQPDTQDEQMMRTKRVFELAELPNVCLKVPGLGELLPRLRKMPARSMPFDQRPAQLAQAIECFGAERLMWGSDYPPVAAREGYRNALEWVRDALSTETEQALEQIFGATARRIFGLPQPS